MIEVVLMLRFHCLNPSRSSMQYTTYAKIAKFVQVSTTKCLKICEKKLSESVRTSRDDDEVSLKYLESKQEPLKKPRKVLEVHRLWLTKYETLKAQATMSL